MNKTQLIDVVAKTANLKKKDAEFLANVNLLGDGPQVISLASKNITSGVI